MGKTPVMRSINVQSCLARACAISTLAVAAPAFADAADIDNLPKAWAALADESTLSTPAAHEPEQWSDGAPNRNYVNYVLPALEIVGFDLLLNLHNRYYVSDDYKSTLSSIRRNLHSRWNEDRDPFATNQLGHPYQGSMYFGFAFLYLLALGFYGLAWAFSWKAAAPIRVATLIAPGSSAS